MRSFYRLMRDCRKVIYEKRDRAAADVYSTVETFLKEGRYSTYRRANELSMLRLSGYTDEVIAAQLGVNVGTVRTHTRNVSTELYKLFGVDFFDMLSNYADNKSNVDSVMYRVKHHGEMAVTYVFPDVVEAIKQGMTPEKSFPLAECGQELDFLRRYSKDFLLGSLELLNREKLLYLVNVLDGKQGSSSEWHSVVSSIIGEVSK